MADPGIEKKDAEIDEEHGVAVVFDEEEWEEPNEEGFEVRDESDDEEEGEPEAEGDGSPDGTTDEDGDTIIVGGELAEGKRTNYPIAYCTGSC